MSKALSQNLESIAALRSLCIFGYQTEDPLAAVTAPDYFASCAGRLMANDMILVCAEAADNPAWGLFLVSSVEAERVSLVNVSHLSPETLNGLTFLRSQAPLRFSGKKRGAGRDAGAAA